ncbi:MAG: hypothetical protein LC808_42405, partial [Actinobacteria bacterium]|nr:hypothetical protein [Actinomycetota bacterium]
MGVELATGVPPAFLAVPDGTRPVADVRGERARVRRMVRQNAKPLRRDAELPRDMTQLRDVSQGLCAFFQLGQ